MSKNAGLIVRTKAGKIGRTYNSKGIINGKVPVYLASAKHKYHSVATLCRPETLTRIGFAD